MKDLDRLLREIGESFIEVQNKAINVFIQELERSSSKDWTRVAESMWDIVDAFGISRAYLDFNGIRIPVKNFTDTTNAEGVLEIGFTCNAPMPENGFLVNFSDALRNKVYFTSIVEYKNGQSLTYLDCVIDSVEITLPGHDTGSAFLSVIALDIEEDSITISRQRHSDAKGSTL